eukprot:GFUD01012938.1.p1 GENE.GFUD01012938.1~~GFUD01012938.1.p1  ORF type:complete len:728 (-),score=120.32 GFUD01012938.1:128-2311(-)
MAGAAPKRIVVIQPTSNGRFTIIPQETEKAGLPFKEFVSVFWRTWVVVLGPFLLSPIVLCSPDDPQTLEALKCAYLILLMAVYWMTEALPLPITSMIPMVGLPLLGLMSTGEVAVNYLNSTNYMFLGGLIMAIAVEHCGLHNRVALKIIMMVGTSQARLMLGFMFTTMFLSMWISNTATTAMMLPIVDAVAEAINEKAQEIEMKHQSPRKEKVGTNANDSPHESEEEDEFNEDDSDIPINQKTITSINQLSLNQKTLNSINQMTINSFNSVNPANDPESMVAFLPNVRRNTMDRLPNTEEARSRFQRRNTMERLPRQESRMSRQESIGKVSITSKEDFRKLQKCISIEVEVDPDANIKEETERNFLLLAVAYAANIGGTGVITGSPPNLVVPDVLISSFGQGTGLTFASWMAFAIPVMLVNVILAWLWLQLLQSWYPGGKVKKGKEQEERAMKVIKEKYESLGTMNLHEAQVLVLFIILICLWFFKTPIFMPGWGDAFNVETVRGSTVSVGSATPAIFMSILLFILPQSYNFWPFASMSQSLQNAPSLITWRLIETKMCWGVIFLLGGGFALAKASQNSGLSTLLVVQLNKMNLESYPLWLVTFIICFVTVTITNVASNTATANVLVPILGKMAVTMCINPIYLTLPAGIVCSYAFALPVATAPNAIVFGHSSMKTTDMMKAGFVMNLICVITLSISINSYAVPLFGLNEFPDWAAAKHPNITLCPS